MHYNAASSKKSRLAHPPASSRGLKHSNHPKASQSSGFFPRLLTKDQDIDHDEQGAAAHTAAGREQQRGARGHKARRVTPIQRPCQLARRVRLFGRQEGCTRRRRFVSKCRSTSRVPRSWLAGRELQLRGSCSGSRGCRTLLARGGEAHQLGSRDCSYDLGGKNLRRRQVRDTCVAAWQPFSNGSWGATGDGGAKLSFS